MRHANPASTIELSLPLTDSPRLPARYAVSRATATDREQIYSLRHQVYATELGQHAENSERRLLDALDSVNEYLVARFGDRVAGFISITSPNERGYSVDKYLPRDELPVPRDNGLYELRLLTIDPAFRQTQLAALLMYASFRWIGSRGASHAIALGRTDATVELYEKVGFRTTRQRARAGAVEYELMTATMTDLRDTVAALPDLTNRLARGCNWELDIPFEEPTPCYHGGASFAAIGDGLCDLDRARDVISADVLDAWFPPSPKVVEAVSAHLPFLLRNSPPTNCAGLLRAVAAARGVPYDAIVPGGGSSDLIFRAFLSWLTPESRVLMLDPTYGEYAHVTEQVVGCRVDRIALERASRFQVDARQLRSRLQDCYDLVILVNPNSPTGQHMPAELLRDTLAMAPATTRVWIDETYIDYCGPGESLESYAAHSTNTVVCKSMSKVYALSGARVAYLCGPPQLVSKLRAITPPWVVSLPAQLAGIQALGDADYYENRCAETHELRSELATGLRSIESIEEVVDGVANFLLCILRPDAVSAEVLCSRCRSQGLYLRDLRSMSARSAPGAFRIAVKDRETNRRMMEIIRRAVAS